MENTGSIPNVSCVFRQLLKISTTNPKLHSINQTDQFQSSNNYYQNNTYQSYNFNEQNSYPSNLVQNDRQQRHQALMSRLKNSLQQNRQLIGGPQNSFQRSSNTLYDSRRNQFNNNGYQQYQTQSYNYNNQPFSNTNNNELRPKQPKKWAPPQLKYRHIDDFQQKSVSIDNRKNEKNNVQTTLPEYMLNQMKLKNQFYESNLSNQNPNQNKQNHFQLIKNQNHQKNTRQLLHEEEDYQEQNQSQNQEQNLNKFSILSQKPSKYTQNLQNYYDICRKPIKPTVLTKKNNSNQQKKINPNTQKFLRRQTPKIQGINLEKAMKILSFDD